LNSITISFRISLFCSNFANRNVINVMTKFQIINEQIYYLIIKQFSAAKIRLIVTIVISNIKSVAESIPSISTMLSIS
ncbi:hypothetical protein, partial [Bacteroides acidifaciens]|uniref:hypothetical protein n=1 Tax=Bacteroides acidifaciens TaxID=85831 RepID=UPI002590C407